MDPNQTNTQTPSTQPTTPPSVQTPTPATPLEEPKKSPNSILVIVSLIILAAIIGSTAYLFIQNRQTDNSAQTNQNFTPANNQNSNSETAQTATSSSVPENVVCSGFYSLSLALQNIEKACVLNLSGQNLSEVPAGIYSLENLNELNLSDNNISAFPSTLFSLPNLIVLDLSNNNINNIPDDFVLPTTVQQLNLEGNPLSQEELMKFQKISQ